MCVKWNGWMMDTAGFLVVRYTYTISTRCFIVLGFNLPV